MLRSLVDLLIAVVELVEAEARDLRRALRRLGVTMAVIGVAAAVALLLLLGAIGLLVAALFLWLLAWVPAALAALVSGVVILAIVGVSTWIAIRSVRS